ncbi:MAG: GNAT family N-acetyltransferase [Microbacteriaceae bacterium]
MKFENVSWFDPRAAALRVSMDVEMTALYAHRSSAQSAEDQAAVTAVLTIDPATIVHTVIATEGEQAIAHAALRPWGDELEVKKVFVSEHARGRGVSRALMGELQRAAEERGIRSLILQTGNLQLAAIALYEAVGFRQIDVFGGYNAIPASVCFRKTF